MYLTFSESFESIEPIVQKILPEPKIFFWKIGTFLVKGVKCFLDRLITFYQPVPLPPNTLQMLMPMLFYYIKLKNLYSSFLQAIFDHFWTFLDIFGPPDLSLFLTDFWHIIAHNSTTVNNWEVIKPILESRKARESHKEYFQKCHFYVCSPLIGTL